MTTMTTMTARVSQLLDLIKTQYFHKDIMDMNYDDEDNNNIDKYSQNCKKTQYGYEKTDTNCPCLIGFYSKSTF